MKIEVVCRDHEIDEILDIEPITYIEALNKAFAKIESNEIVSSWKDAYASSGLKGHISDFIQVPTYGCFRDEREMEYKDRENALKKFGVLEEKMAGILEIFCGKLVALWINWSVVLV